MSSWQELTLTAQLWMHQLSQVLTPALITFRASRRRHEMYSGHSLLCLSFTAYPHYCMDPDVTWGNGRGCPLVLHCWADLQLVHGFHCYGNITLNVKCKRVLVLTLCLVDFDCPSDNHYCHRLHYMLQCFIKCHYNLLAVNNNNYYCKLNMFYQI